MELYSRCISEEVTCDSLNCGRNAECRVTRYGSPQCACVDGYEGDGNQCTVVPSEVSITGYPRTPDEV